MAVAIVNTWSNFFAANTFIPLQPQTTSVQCTVANTPGNWLYAVVVWRPMSVSTGVSCTVSDDAHNWWDPVGTSPTSADTGKVKTTIWRAPLAKACTNVMAAPSDPVAVVGIYVLEFSGLSNVSDIASNTRSANSTTSLSSMTVNPGVSSFILTACGSDLFGATITQGGAGWTTITRVQTTNGIDTTMDLAIAPQWQVASGSVTSTYTSSSTQDLSASMQGDVVTVAAPAQPDPFWPSTTLEVAPAAGFLTLPDATTWVPVTTPVRFLSMNVTQGKNYELDALQAGTGTVKMDDPSGQLVPPGGGSYAGVGSGSPLRLRMYWPGGAWQVNFHGTGAVATPGIDTGQVFVTVPGQSYTASAFLNASVTYASGVRVAIQFRNSGGTLINTATSTAAATGPNAVLCTATGTAGATAVKANVIFTVTGTPASTVIFSAAAAFPVPGSSYLTIPPATSWAALNSATVSTLASFTPDRRGAPNVSPYYVAYSGYIERLPPAWDPETLRGYTETTVNDAWAYATGLMQPILPTEILNDNPYGYWPCTEPAGSGTATNLAPNNPLPMVVTRSKYGAGSNTEGFAQNSGAILGGQNTYLLTQTVRTAAQSGMWGQTLSSTTNTNQGYSLFVTDANLPLISNGATVECWFQLQAPIQILGGQLVTIMSVNTLRGGAFALTLDVPVSQGGTGHLFINGGGTFTTISTTNYQVTNSPLTHVLITFNQSSWASYINGVLTATGSFPNALSKHMRNISVNGWAGTWQEGFAGFGSEGFYSGFAGHIAVYNKILPVNRILTHYQAGNLAMEGDTSSGRIERLLEAVQFQGRRLILQETQQNITEVASCQDVAGQPVNQSLANITLSTSPSILYVASTGDLAYVPRQYVWNNAVDWVLGEQTETGEIPYETVTYDDDPTKVINSIEVTQLDDQSVTLPTFSETASLTQFGLQSFWFTGYLEFDITNETYSSGPDTQDLANWLATTNDTALLRVQSVTVNAAGQPYAWPLILGVNPGDIATVNRRPPTATGELISVTGRVIHVERSISFADGTASVTLILDAAPEVNALTADDPVRGLLNGTNVLSW